MRKLILFVALILPGAAFGQGVRYNDIAMRPNGMPVLHANVAVCQVGANTTLFPCQPLATTYSDQTLTVACNQAGSHCSNPTTSGNYGNYGFWAPPGHYIVEIYGPGLITLAYDVFLPCDASGAPGQPGACAENISLPVSIADGGTGTATPSPTAGSNISITGTWPANTIAVTGTPEFSGLVTSDAGFIIKTNSFPRIELQNASGTAHWKIQENTSGGTQHSFTIYNAVAGTNPFAINTSDNLVLLNPLAVAYGGTGTATPSLGAGQNIGISGSWPNQTVAVSNLQGTDSKLLTAGTVSGTGSPLCTDTSGGATTSGCTSGGASDATMTDVGYLAGNAAACSTANSSCRKYVFPNAHTLVRLVANATQAPSGCSTNASWGVVDLTSSTVLEALTPTTTGILDSGAISASMPAGHQIGVGITQTAAGCATQPVAAVTATFE